MIEFVLAVSLLLVPILLSTIIVGLSLVLANQVTEVCRDVGHMYAYGVDFSQSSSQTLVTSKLAQGLNMTNSGGNAVIYLSTVTYVDGSSCTASGYQANSGSCPNINHYVVTKRLVIGNTGISSAAFAPSITSSDIGSNGDIGSSSYLTDPSVRADNFSGVISMTASGQYAYVSEMFDNPPSGGLWNLFSSNLVVARNVF